MLYEEKYLENLRICPGCKKSRLNEARILPCGIFCSLCADEVSQNLSKCKFCGEAHFLPKNGFKPCEPIVEFNSIQPKFIDQIYRGEQAEKLKTNLTLIKTKIDHLKLDLNFSVEKIRRHCEKLKRDVEVESELLSKHLSEIKKSLIKKIDDYETQRISGFNTGQFPQEKFLNFIKEMELFVHEWSSYLKKTNINDSELNLANEKANELKKRFRRESKEVHDFIFQGKKIELVKELSRGKILGKIELINVKKIDFNDYFEESLASLFLNYSSMNKFAFDALDTEKFAVVYTDNLGYLNFVIVDEDKSVQRTIFTNLLNTDCLVIKIINKGKNVLFAGFNKVKDTWCVVNADLESSEFDSGIVTHSVLSIAASDEFIYLLGEGLLIYDWGFRKLKTIEKFECENLDAHLKMIDYRKKRLFLLDVDKLNVYDEETYELVTSISVRGDKLCFDSLDNFFILSVQDKRIFKYTLDGELLDEIELDNVPDGLDFAVDSEDQFVFMNKIAFSFFRTYE